MPNKIYIAVTISLVVLTAVLTVWIVGSRGSGDEARELAFRVTMQCDSWARELEDAAKAYEEHARAPIEKPTLPFGWTHFERITAASRISAEQKFCWFVRKREAPNLGSAEIDDASSAFTARAADPSQIAQAVRSLADAAKRNAALEIGP